MSAHELIFTERPTLQNKVTGHYMKGHIPFNKSRKWSEYMSKRSQRRCARGWANIDKFRNKGACAGWNKRAVVAITEDGVFVGRFESGMSAARASGAQPRNINLCCRKMRRHAGKTIDGRRLRWFYENDDRWINEIRNN
jgi:hypothetical protein